MKFKLNRPLKSVLGQVVVRDDGKTQATVADAVATALGKLSPRDAREGIPPGESFRRGKLAQRLLAAKGEVEISAEDVTLAKKAVENYYEPAIVAVIVDALEGGAP